MSITNKEKIAWLAGFIDADGCVRLKKGWKNKKGINSFVPQVTVHNTCLVTLNHAITLLEEIVPGFKTSARLRTSKVHAPMYNIEILGIRRVKSLLKILRPHLITKALEADLLKRFIDIREGAKSHNAKYGSEEFRIFFALKGLKKERHLRDFVPTIEEVLNQDKVRTNARALEVAEMSTRLSEDEKRKRASKLVWYRKDRSPKVTTQ